jgi:ATP adenylyltransferase
VAGRVSKKTVAGNTPDGNDSGATAGPDRLERLWTPHRMAYISGAVLPAQADLATEAGCPFCRARDGADEDGLVVARGQLVFAVLNLYPYNPGHLMVLPYRHVADFPDLDPAETTEFAAFSQQAMRVIRSVSAPHGFNLGMNQGAVAGAGIAAHLHQHVVPRWGGDTNFMPVIAGTKTLPQLLGDTRALLAGAWAATGTSPAQEPAPKKAAAKTPKAAKTPTKAAARKRAPRAS